MNQEILNRYLTGDASAEEKQMVVRWLDADPQHMRCLLYTSDAADE